MYGTQTLMELSYPITVFENDVKMYGTQTSGLHEFRVQFENDVKMYGTETAHPLNEG